MPKNAFLRLSPEDRDELAHKAMQVYVDKSYEEITLQLLLDTLGLNPATFYRYFEDKDELYFYCTKLCYDKEINYLKKVNENFIFDIFTFYEDSSNFSELENEFCETLYKLPWDMLWKLYDQIFKKDLFNQYKTALRRLRMDGKLRADVDEDLISYMYATTMFNMLMFYREFGIKDRELKIKMKKYFYMSFFKHGLLEDPNEKGEEQK